MDRCIPLLGTWRIKALVVRHSSQLTGQRIGFALLTAISAWKPLTCEIQKPSDRAGVPPYKWRMFYPSGQSLRDWASEGIKALKPHLQDSESSTEGVPDFPGHHNIFSLGILLRKGSKVSWIKVVRRPLTLNGQLTWAAVGQNEINLVAALVPSVCHVTALRTGHQFVQNKVFPPTALDPRLGVPANRGSSKQSWYRIRRLSGQRQFHSAGDYWRAWSRGPRKLSPTPANRLRWWASWLGRIVRSESPRTIGRCNACRPPGGLLTCAFPDSASRQPGEVAIAAGTAW